MPPLPSQSLDAALQSPSATIGSRYETSSRLTKSVRRGVRFAVGMLVGVACLLYIAAFAQVRLSSFGVDTASGVPLQRLEFWMLLARCPQFLVQQWAGGDVSRIGGLDRLPVLLLAAVWLVCCYGVGRWAMRGLGLAAVGDHVTRSCLTLGVGLSLMSVWVSVLGVCGWLKGAWLLTLPACSLLAWWVEWRRRRGADPHPDGGGRLQASAAGISIPGWAFAASFPFAILMLLAAMLPSAGFDAKCYHLQAAKEFQQAGSISFSPHNVYANMPLGAEMHVLAGMLLWPGHDGWWHGALVGKLLLAVMSLLTAASVFGLTRQLGGSRPAASLAALLYLTTPWTHYVSVNGLIDGVVAMYLVLTFSAVLQASRAKACCWSYSFLIGLLAGSAVACKYPALLFIAAPALAAVVGIARFQRHEDMRSTVGLFCIALLGLLLACGVWLGKNTLATGNPVYPLAADVIPTGSWSEQQHHRFDRVHSPPVDPTGQSHGWRQLLRSTLHVGLQSNWQNPLLAPLALVALAFAPVGERRAAWMLAVLLLIYFLLWWSLTHRVDRFLLPALPLAAVLAGLGTMSFSQGAPRVALLVLLFFGFGVNGLTNASRAIGDNRLLLRYELARNDAPVASGGGYSRVHPAHRLLNQIVADNERLLLVGDSRPFDLNSATQYSTPFNTNPIERVLAGPDLAARRRMLNDLAVDYVYVAWADIDRERSAEGYGFTDMITRDAIREGLVKRDQLLIPVAWPLPDDFGQLFRVVGTR